MRMAYCIEGSSALGNARRSWDRCALYGQPVILAAMLAAVAVAVHDIAVW